MLFDWSYEKIEYFAAASEYTGFHKKLAKYILPHLSQEDDLIDVGCGLGLIDFELASEVNSITAIDENSKVIESLAEQVKKRGVKNIFPKVKDFNDIIENKWDILLLSFFGEPDDTMKALIDGVQKKTILITHGQDNEPLHSKVLPLVRTVFLPELEDYFVEMNYNYTKQNIIMDFGQPLKSMDDAICFLDSYALQEDPIEKKERLDTMLSRLVETDNEKYPLFLPKERCISILVMEK